MSGEAPRLLPEVDSLLDSDRAAMGTVLTAYNGGDPLNDPPALGYPNSIEVEMARRIPLMQQRNQQMNDAVFLNPQSGWGEIKTFMDGVFDRYKAQNDAQVVKVPRNEQEAAEQMQQMRPVQVDPNEVAAIRQLAVKLDQQMKAIDPATSFWTDPRTRSYAEWLNREAGPGTAGFMQSGEQPVNMGVVGRTAYTAWQGVEGMGNATTSLIHGLWDMGRQSISAMGGPDIGASYPTNYIEAEDGTLVNNGGKAPSMMDGISMLWAHATGQNVERFAAEAGRAQEWEQANRAGFGGLVTSVSRLGGEIVGMAPGFGAAAKVGEMTLGKLTQKGLQSLGTLRLTKGLAQSERGLKIIGAMSKGIGQASGMAAYEATTQGRIEGYGAAYMHGLMMAPVLMTLGALGKKTEWFAEHRVNMPPLAARAVAGALEGAGFGAVETIAPEVLPSAWGFIRSPSEGTWETFAKNMLAFGLVKMGTGRTTTASPEEMAMRRGIGRAQFAEKVARGEATAEEIGTAPVANESKLRDLGEASMRSREGATSEERTAARERQREVESDLDVEEFGKGPAEEAVAEYRGPDEPAARAPTVEEARDVAELPEGEAKRARTIEMLSDEGKAVGRSRMTMQEKVAALRTLPAGPEKRALTIKHLQAMRGALGRNFAEFVKTQAERAYDVDLQSMKNRKEMGEAQAVISALLGAEGKTASDYSGPVKKHIGPEKMGQIEELVADKPRREPTVDEGVERFAKELEAEHEGEGEFVKPKSMTGEELSELKQNRADYATAGEERFGANVPRETVEQRAAQSRSPSGVRAGAQSFQLPPTTQVAATPGTKPISMADIYRIAEGHEGRGGFRIPLTNKRLGATEGTAVQTAFRGGHIGKEGTAGLFKLFENLGRTKEGRDAVVLAHEWAHDMQRHMISKRGGREFVRVAKEQFEKAVADDPKIAHDMGVVLKDYPGADQLPGWHRWMETWAEWHARNLLGEVGLDAKVPAVSNFMRRWLAAPENARLKPQYLELQEGLYRYNAQGSLERLGQSIVSGAAAPTDVQKRHQPGWLKRAKQAVNTSMFDDMAKLKASQDKWVKASGRDPSEVSIIEDPARLADAVAMTASKTAEHFTRVGIKNGDKFAVGLEPILKSLSGKEKDFEKYVVAVRNMELYQKGKEIQLPPQDYIESVKQLSEKHPEFADAAKRLKAWTDGLIDYVAQSGNLAPDAAEKIKQSYAVYVPFFRAIEGPAQHGQGRGVAERGTGLSNIKGSTYEVKDPFVALQQVARSMIAKAHQNQVMTALYKMAIGQEAGGLASLVDRTKVPTDHPLRELLDKIEAKVELPGDAQHEMESIFEELRRVDALDPQTITMFSQKVIPTGERNLVAYTPRLSKNEIELLVEQGGHRGKIESANNKLQWLELDTNAYETLMGIDKMPMLPQKYQPVLSVLRAPAVMTRLFATGVNVSFAAANAIRDMMSAPIMDAKRGFRPLGGLIDFVRGAAIYHEKGQIRDLYDELGVKTSSFWTEGRQRALIGEQQQIWHKARRAIENFEDLVATPENYIRISAFKDAYTEAKAANKTEFEARMLALEAGKEITVNFSRAGFLARAYNQFTPYFNAGLQGQRKLWGNLLMGGVDSKTDAQRATVQRSAILNGIASITLPSMFFWWLHHDEDWYQDLPEWRKIGYLNTKIGDQIISIPKPFEAGVLFGGIPQLIADRMGGENAASIGEALKGLAGPYAQIGSVIPAFLKPVVEISTNHNLFTGRPLTPEWISRANPPTEQATFYTTETAKIVSRALRGFLTPTEVEAMVGGYTAGSAVTAMQMIDEITGMKDHPGLSANPFARFTKQQVHGQSDYVDKLYSLSVRLDQNEATLSAKDTREKHQVDTAKRRISDLRKQHREGRISQEEAERRSYEIARPIVERDQER